METIKEQTCRNCGENIRKAYEPLDFDPADFLTLEDAQRLTNYEIKRTKCLYEITDANWEYIDSHTTENCTFGRDYMFDNGFRKKIFEKDGTYYYVDPSMSDIYDPNIKVKFKRSKYLYAAFIWTGKYDRGFSAKWLPDGNYTYRFCKNKCALEYAEFWAKQTEA